MTILALSINCMKKLLYKEDELHDDVSRMRTLLIIFYISYLEGKSVWYVKKFGVECQMLEKGCSYD